MPGVVPAVTPLAPHALPGPPARSPRRPAAVRARGVTRVAGRATPRSSPPRHDRSPLPRRGTTGRPRQRTARPAPPGARTPGGGAGAGRWAWNGRNIVISWLGVVGRGGSPDPLRPGGEVSQGKRKRERRNADLVA